MWIEVHQSLPTHAKTLEAAALLDIAEAQVVGHVVCLWLWALDNSTEGRLRLDRPRVLARAALWPGDPGRFLDALVVAGFLEEDGAIHDWQDYTGRLMARRKANAEKQARWRLHQLQQQRTRNADGTAGSTETLGTAATGPNRTGPNRTGPNPPPSPAPPNRNTLSSESVGGGSDEPRDPPTLATLAANDPIGPGAGAHPAVVLYRRVTGGRPNATVRALVEAAIPEDDAAALAQWHRVLTEWLARGHAVRNVRGLLDWYRDGIPGIPERPQPSTTPPGSSQVPYVQPQSQQRQPLPADLPDLGELTRIRPEDFAKFTRRRRPDGGYDPPPSDMPAAPSPSRAGGNLT